MNKDLMFSSKNMNWCTPQKFFEELDKEFYFVLDVAATDKSAKCENILHQKMMDYLKVGILEDLYFVIHHMEEKLESG